MGARARRRVRPRRRGGRHLGRRERAQRLRALAASLRGLVETTSTIPRRDPNEQGTNDPNEPERASPSSDPREAFAALETLADAREYARLVATPPAPRRERNASDGFDAASKASRGGGRSRRASLPGSAGGSSRTPPSGRRCATEAGVAPVEDEPEDESEFEAEFEAEETGTGAGARRSKHPGRKRRGKKRTVPVPGGNRTRTRTPAARWCFERLGGATHRPVGPRGDRRRLERGGGGEGRVVGIVRSGVATRG